MSHTDNAQGADPHGGPAAGHGAVSTQPAPPDRDTTPGWGADIARKTFIGLVALTSAYVGAVIVYVFGTN